MTLKDELGLLPRFLYIVVGITLVVAAISSDYHNWTLIEAGKLPPFGFLLINVVALPLATGIILWACIGRHREWRIADGQIRIRLLSLTSWRKTRYIKAVEISQLTPESYADERAGRRVTHGWIIFLKDGRRLVSPKTFDKAGLDQVRLRIESQMRRPEPEVDPLAEAMRANNLSG
jgi:hypothetical protein